MVIPKPLLERIERLARDPRMRQLTEQVARELCEKGLLTEAGWTVWDRLVLPADASTLQRVETKRAFFAGAYHLFSAVFLALAAGSEPTEADLRRMDLLHSELEGFFRAGPGGGH